MDDRHKKAIVGMSSMPVPEDQRTDSVGPVALPSLVVEWPSMYYVRKMFTTPTAFSVSNQLILHTLTTPLTLRML